MSRILQLFSGGRDSFLSVCRLLQNDENRVVLVTYTNGCCIGLENVEHEAKRIIGRYGEDRVCFHGVHNVVGLWREFFIPIMNLKTSEISSTYGEITYSQINCVTCRMAMYAYSIALCKKLGIYKISDGARYSQKFVIELEPMISRIQELLLTYNMELLTPVIDVTSDWSKKNELLLHGFTPKTLESQCLLGVPLNQDVSEEVINGVLHFYDTNVATKMAELVDKIYGIMDEDGYIRNE